MSQIERQSNCESIKKLTKPAQGGHAGYTFYAQSYGDVQAVEKMHQKMSIILQAYEKLAEKLRKKEARVSFLEKENHQLKDQLRGKVVQIGLSKDNAACTARYQGEQKATVKDYQAFLKVGRNLRAHSRSQSPQLQQRQIGLSKINHYYSLNRQHHPIQIDEGNFYQCKDECKSSRLLKQSKSQGQLLHLTINRPFQRQQSNVSILKEDKSHPDQVVQPVSPVKSKIFTGYKEQNQCHLRQNLHSNYHMSSEQCKEPFMDILGKLKGKINNFEERQKQQIQLMGKVSPELSRVKSLKNMKDETKTLNKTMSKKGDLQALKEIWSQRDSEIKKMDALFNNIDEKLHVVAAQRG